MEKEYFVLYTPDEMNKAYSLINQDFSQEEIMKILMGEDDIAKQAALIHLEKINSNSQAEILVSLLTGQHGPIREICSAKINEFMQNDSMRTFFGGEKIKKILLDALNDIIPTVARNILEILKYSPDKEEICSALMDRIIALKDSQEEIETLSNHEITKRVFKLYWYMEALAEIAEEIEDLNKLEQIIEFTYQDENYTIREKSSKILSKIGGFEKYKSILKEDKNPYVFFYLK